MKDIQRILFKVLVRAFYRVNAGFFLVVVGICFGFLRDVEHIALAQYFISAPFLLLIPIFVWLLYALKIITFNKLSLNNKENEFLYTANALYAFPLLIQILLVSAWQFIPASLYGLFLIWIARHENQTLIEILIAGSVVLLHLFIAVNLYKKIRHPNLGVSVGFLRRKINSVLTRPGFLFYPEWITKRQPVLIIGTKVFACLMVIAISRLYMYDAYDMRLFAMGCSLAFSFNLVIVFYYHRFENFHFQLLRGLPLPLNRRLLHFCLTWTLLMLPEIGAMVNYFPEGLSRGYLLSILLFGVSTGIIGYSSLFIKDITLERFIQYVFWISFSWIVIILFKLPLMLLAMVQIGIGFTIYYKYFYGFEFNSEINSEK